MRPPIGYVLVLFFLILGPMHLANASDRVEHFEGQSASSVEEALLNLARYNEELSKRLASEEITTETSYEVHQLTYTLENALERLAEELDQAQQTLEAVHLASEANHSETMAEEGAKYLEHSQRLFFHTQGAAKP